MLYNFVLVIFVTQFGINIPMSSLHIRFLNHRNQSENNLAQIEVLTRRHFVFVRHFVFASNPRLKTES